MKKTPEKPPVRQAPGVARAAAGSRTAQANQDHGERRNGRLAARNRSRTGSRSSSTSEAWRAKSGSYSEGMGERCRQIPGAHAPGYMLMLLRSTPTVQPRRGDSV